MTHQPHDKLAKIVIEALAHDRQVSFETEMWPDIRGDVIVSPGQPLPAFTGMLGTLLEQGTTLLEFYHGRPTAVDLLHAQAKGALLQARTLKQGETARTTSEVQVVIVSIGHPQSALRVAYGAADWKRAERGVATWDGPQRHRHLDLLRLRVDAETAWLHLAGNSPHLEDALALLMKSDYDDVVSLLERLKEEVSFMPSIREAIPVGGDHSGPIRFLKAWERAELLQKGRQEGLLEEARRVAARLLSRHLGTSQEAVLTLSTDLSDPEQVEALIEHGLQLSSLEELTDLAKTLVNAHP